MAPPNRSKKRKIHPPNDIFRYLEKRPPSQPGKKEENYENQVQSMFNIEDVDDDVTIIDSKSSQSSLFRPMFSYQKKTDSTKLNKITSFITGSNNNNHHNVISSADRLPQQPSTSSQDHQNTPNRGSYNRGKTESKDHTQMPVQSNRSTSPSLFHHGRPTALQKQRKIHDSSHLQQVPPSQKVPGTQNNSTYNSPISKAKVTPHSRSTPKRLNPQMRFKQLELEFNEDSSDCDTVANVHEAHLRSAILNSTKINPSNGTPSLFTLPCKRRRASKPRAESTGLETPKSRLSSNLSFTERISNCSFRTPNDRPSSTIGDNGSPKYSLNTSQVPVMNCSPEKADHADVHNDSVMQTSAILINAKDKHHLDDIPQPEIASSSHNDDDDEEDFLNTSLLAPTQSPRPSRFIEPHELPFGINDLTRWPLCPLKLKELKGNKKILVMFRTPLKHGIAPTPVPSEFKIIEKDQVGQVVLLPCDPLNTIINHDSNDIFKWDLIVKELKGTRFQSVDDLENVMKGLNPAHSEFNLNSLRDVLDTVSDKMSTEFLHNLLPKIVELALSLKEIVTQPLPLLRQGESKTLVLSQKQVASLMANAFLCLYPKRNSSLFRNYPDINFWRLLSGSNSTKVEKLKCIINYFKRVTDTDPTGVVSFSRMALTQENSVQWSDSKIPLTRLAISLDGRIEKEGRGMLQVDFANQMIGGGILAHGCVQEEIIFAICPEMIISRLFCERLLDYEVVFITGAEQYNNYEGYADTFKWTGNFVDETPLDSWGRRMHRVVAMDAKMFTRASHYNQFKSTYIDRELNKAYCGFNESRVVNRDFKVAVATGNWGCGVFGGDRQLKFLIQLLAASQAERDILYFTFGDKSLKKAILDIYNFLIERRATVSVLYNMIAGYFECVQKALELKTPEPDLFGYLQSTYHKEGQLVVSTMPPTTIKSLQQTENGGAKGPEENFMFDDELSLG